MGKAKSSFEIESLLAGVKRPTFQDLVNNQKDYADNYQKDQLEKNKGDQEEFKPTNSISADTNSDDGNSDFKETERPNVFIVESDSDGKSMDTDHSISYNDILNYKTNKDNTGKKCQHVIIGNNLKFQVEDLIYKMNKSSQKLEDDSKKITIRDFVESAIINYLEKFNL